jgi:LacI family transcriptional regulator
VAARVGVQRTSPSPPDPTNARGVTLNCQPEGPQRVAACTVGGARRARTTTYPGRERETVVPPTLKDVAAEAGVSVMTVSNVLNGRRGKATAATTERVLAAVERLGYVRSGHARALSAAPSDLVALLYPPAAPGEVAFDNPHDAAFVSEVERQVSAGGRHLMVAATSEVESAAARLWSWRVDGAIFVRTFADEVDALRERHQIPMVFVDNYSQSPLVANLGIDDRGGGRLAGRHLVEHGHTRIAFVGPRNDVEGVVRQRYLGLRDALDGDGLTVRREDVLRCDASFEEGIRIAGVLAARGDRPTGVFATADVIAAGLLKGFAARGVWVPEEVSIVGFDDLPIARHMTPELTTIHQDIAAKARTAVDLLVRLVDDDAQEVGDRVELPVSLVSRGSVASPPDGGVVRRARPPTGGSR